MNSRAQLLKNLLRRHVPLKPLIKADDAKRTELKTYVMASSPERIHVWACIHATHIKLIPSHGIRKAAVKATVTAQNLCRI